MKHGDEGTHYYCDVHKSGPCCECVPRKSCRWKKITGFGWMDETDFLHELGNVPVMVYAKLCPTKYPADRCCKMIRVKIVQVRGGGRKKG